GAVRERDGRGAHRGRGERGVRAPGLGGGVRDRLTCRVRPWRWRERPIRMRRSARDQGPGEPLAAALVRSEVLPMCGIVGYVGQRPVQDLLLAGLEKLEYRGYDSAGISMASDGHVDSVRAVGNPGALRAGVAGRAGTDAVVAMAGDERDRLVGARKECPLIVGRGDGGQSLASAIPAFLRETRRVQQINDDEIGAITAAGARFFSADGTPIEREVDEVTW